MRRSTSCLALLVLSLGSCGASRSVPIKEVAGSGVSGEVRLTEAFTKSLYTRVDAWLEVDGATAEGGISEMRAVLKTGRCTTPGGTLIGVTVHARGESGAADVLLPEGEIGDLDGGAIVQVFAGEHDKSTLLACGEL